MSAPLKTWVVKAGSHLICEGGPLLIQSWMAQAALLRRRHGVQIIWVTSGAIASARDRYASLRLGSKGKMRASLTPTSSSSSGHAGSLVIKQALSAIGQPMIMDQYNLALNWHGLSGAQILLTYDDLRNAKRREHFRNTVRQLLKWGVVPIINENDAVATEELQFGDNDNLSSKVAQVVPAHRLVILTDVAGLYDRDPHNPKLGVAKLVAEVESVTPSILALAGKKSASGRGRGGMYSKVLAAASAQKAGIETWLLKGDQPNVLVDLAKECARGTVFRRKKH